MADAPFNDPARAAAPPAWPVISVVTTCRDAEATLEATLASLHGQGYPALEHIVIDAASGDGTAAILERWRDRFAVLRREPDAGQYHGLAKGLALAGGEVMAWLNADDLYHPWTLRLVGAIFARFPDVDWIIGTPGYAEASGACTRLSGQPGCAYPREHLRNGWYRESCLGYLQQESMFWRRRLWQRAGGLDLTLRHAADFDLWRRFAEHAELVSVAAPLALFRQRPGVQRSSTGRAPYAEEVDRVCRDLDGPSWPWRTLAARHEGVRHLWRALQWRRARVIAWSARRRDWVLAEGLRPLSRTSWAELTLERAVRRAEAAEAGHA